MKLIDYWFYRIYIFYNKYPNEIPLLRACIALAFVFFFFILSLIVIVSVVIGKLPFEPTNEFVLILVLFFFLFLARYVKGSYYKKVLAKFMDEPEDQKRRGGWVLASSFFLIILFPLLIIFLNYNLGMAFF